MNLGMMKQALEMRSKLEKAQKELAKKTVEAEAGKGAVKVLVFKAVNDALDAAQDMAAKELNQITGGLKIPGLT